MPPSTRLAPIVESICKPPALTAESLCDQFLSDVYAYISRRLPDRQDAEDATSETFQAALGALHRLRGSDPKLWLLGIARRKVIDTYRRTRRRREASLEIDTIAPGSLHGELEQSQRKDAIRRLVMALPDDQREALLLQQLEGLSIAEIGVVMGRSSAAINSLIQRARARAYREGKAYFQEEIS